MPDMHNLEHIPQLSQFSRELVVILARRATQANDFARMFSVPNSLYQIVLGYREPTDNDFIEIAARLDVSEDYLRRLHAGEGPLASEFVPPPLSGG